MTRWVRGVVTSAPAAQAERLFLWTPVAFGCGAAAYMTVAHEPPLWLLGLTFAAALIASAVWARVGRAGLTGMVLLLLALGAAGALA